MFIETILFLSSSAFTMMVGTSGTGDDDSGKESAATKKFLSKFKSPKKGPKSGTKNNTKCNAYPACKWSNCDSVPFQVLRTSLVFRGLTRWWVFVFHPHMR